jgi:hypothetical protein
MTATLTSFFTKLTSRQQGRQQTQSQRYQQFVVALADGKSPDTEAVDELLDALDKTTDDLQRDVERLVKRRVARGQIERAKGVSAETEKLLAEHKKVEQDLDTEIKALQAKAAEATAKIIVRLEEAKKLQAESDRARDYLLKTADLPNVTQQIEELKEKAQAARARRIEGEQQHAPNLMTELRQKNQATGMFKVTGAEEAANEARIAEIQASLDRQKKQREAHLVEADRYEKQAESLAAQYLLP